MLPSNTIRIIKYLSAFFYTAVILLNCQMQSVEGEIIKLSNDSPTHFVFGKSVYYKLLSENTSLEQVLDKSKSEFIKSSTNFLSFGITEEEVWLRFELQKEDNEEWLIEVQFPNLDRISYFVVKDGEMILKLETGFAYPESSRIYHHPFFLFPIPLASGRYEIYFNLKSEDAIILPMLLWRIDKFYNYDGWKYLLFGAFSGILLSLAAYNFLLFLSIKDKSYLYYVGYILSFYIFVTCTFGMGGYLLGDLIYPFLVKISLSAGVSATFFSVAFCRGLCRQASTFRD